MWSFIKNEKNIGRYTWHLKFKYLFLGFCFLDRVILFNMGDICKICEKNGRLFATH